MFDCGLPRRQPGRDSSINSKETSMATQIRTLLAVFAFGLALSVLSVGAEAQSPSVYVSGGTTIYTLSGGSLTPIFTLAEANFESLAGGPDNADLDAGGNAQHPFM